MILHTVSRALLHLFSATGVLLGVFFGLSVLARRYPKWPLPRTISKRLLLCAFLVVFVAFLREPFDVAHGDPGWKSYVDLLSWVMGVGLGYWASYRLVRMDWY